MAFGRRPLSFGLLFLASLAVATSTPPNAVKSRLAATPVQQCRDTSPVAKLRGGTCVAEGGDSDRLTAMEAWHPVLLALIGTSFGWFMTALGAAAVVIKRLGLPEPIFRKERQTHLPPTTREPAHARGHNPQRSVLPTLFPAPYDARPKL
jgi:hypothetical protein